MRASRFLVGSVSSIVWPAVVLLIPMGITFAAARVYAESAPAPPACDAGIVVACQDASANSTCTTPNAPNAPALCQSSSCRDPGAAFSDTLACTAVVTCDAIQDECTGRAAGDSCSASQGICTPTVCYQLSGDAGTPKSVLVCRPGSVPDEAGPPKSSSSSSGSTSPSASDAGANAAPSDDSGCASTPGSVSSAFAMLGAPLALGLLLARRRRRR